ncbi:MAG TPA: pyrroline-5-carboxylate reductase [Prolixibacteraceae bacterium]|nr:pyrroline-5-carboxylate reductase [Prolixibacteraceae bacterium]HRV88364.1 pyrroline-5-carboxylate reductase [Prolixibacteraceae bacterium]
MMTNLRETMKHKKITIIGGGNLGTAIAEGLINSGEVQSGHLTVTRRRTELLQRLRDKGVNTTSDNSGAVREADVVLLAVKPYQVLEILRQITPQLSGEKVLISLVAGVELRELAAVTGPGIPLFRAMPNTAIALRESMTLISTNGSSDAHKQMVVELFEKMGRTAVIPDELMAAATVLASCGIAYALRYIRAAMQGGVEIGFGAELAQFITAQTVLGAARLVLETGNHPEKEIDKVTTPRGVTITGLNEMENKGFSASLIQGLLASYKKIEKLENPG